MRASSLMMCLLLLSMPATTVCAVDNAPVEAATSTQVSELCRRIIFNARRIGSLLNTINDFESANRATPQLNHVLREIKDLLVQLEQLPYDEETADIISVQMITLTHIAQSHMPQIQKLSDNNAYGSAPLAAFLRKLNACADREHHGNATDDPYTQIYDGMSIALNNAISNLRKVVDNSTAQAAAFNVGESLAKYRCLQAELKTLLCLESPQQDLHSRQSYISILKTEMECEFKRLNKQQFFNDSELPVLVQEYLNLLN